MRSFAFLEWYLELVNPLETAVGLLAMAPRSGLLALVLCFTMLAALLLHADATSDHVTLPQDIPAGNPTSTFVLISKSQL